jgi:WD40 repeat protein
VAKRVWETDYIYFIHFDQRKPIFESRSISVPSADLLALAIPADGKRIFGLMRAPREIEFWRLIRTWSMITEKTLDETAVVSNGEQLICSATGLFVAVGANGGTALTLVRTSSNAEMQLDTDDAFRIAFSPSGKFLASGGQFIRCWSTRSGKMNSRFRGQDEDIPDLAFSPDERLLAIARTDGPVEFWDFREARMVRSYSWNIGRLSAIAISPDGLTCAVAGEQGRIVIFDLDDL